MQDIANSINKRCRMWRHSGCDICYPTDYLGWLGWSGWLGGYPLHVHLSCAQSKRMTSLIEGGPFFGQGYTSSCVPLLDFPSKLPKMQIQPSLWLTVKTHGPVFNLQYSIEIHPDVPIFNLLLNDFQSSGQRKVIFEELTESNTIHLLLYILQNLSL